MEEKTKPTLTADLVSVMVEPKKTTPAPPKLDKGCQMIKNVSKKFKYCQFTVK